jgi:hypothetical protein
MSLDQVFGQFQYPTVPLEGSRGGAPDAIQVAYRFHRWQNLCTAVAKTVVSCRADLPEPVPEPTDPQPAGPGSNLRCETTGPASGRDTGNGRLAVRSRERHAAIHDLLAQGRNYTQISQMLGLSPHNVREFARAATADQVITGPSPRSSRLDRFAPTCSSAATRAAPTPPSCSPKSRHRATPAANAQRAATCSRCAPRSLRPCSRHPRRQSGR